MVWYGGGGGGGGWVYLDYNVSSVPFLSFEIEIGDGPGPELDNKELKNRILTYLKSNEKDLLENLSPCTCKVYTLV